MNLHALYHRPKSNYCYCYDFDRVHIRFRAARKDLEQVVLIHGDKYEWQNKQYKVMELVATDALYDYFEAEVEPVNKRLAYIFELTHKGEQLYYTEWGISKSINEKEIYQQFYQYPYMHESEIHVAPQWARDAVFYQIFPERFQCGDPSISPENLSQWNSKPEPKSFYGGDLQGIIDQLDYIEGLGITALYLTPIFESPSNHKYDTIDYFKLDPHFGDMDTFKELVQRCHSRGIRVLLDAVFNHSGYFFKPFQDVVHRGPESPYYDWFHIKGWPFEKEQLCYETFAFVPQMPKLNTQNPQVKEYLLSAAKYWVEEADIDGWRLDVSDEIDHEFWRDFRKTVKSVKPDAYILGENWLNSLPWLMGDQFDAVMNYPFTRNCIQYFAYDNITATQFREYIDTILMNHTKQVNEVMFNLLDSHDTPRFLTLSESNKNSLKLAAAFQFTYLGTPCIYYGTEIGMEGAGDPDCRRAMEWNEEHWDQELYEYYKKLIAIRRNSEALRRGSFRWLNSGEALLAFERKTEKDQAVIVINNSPNVEAFFLQANGEKVLDALENQGLKDSKTAQLVELKPYSARIFLIEEAE